MTALRSTAVARTSRTTAWALDGAPDWRARALCGPAVADWFDVTRSALTESNLEALRLCQACPVRPECAADILAADLEHRRSVIAGGMVFGRGGRAVPVKVPSLLELRVRERDRERRREQRQQMIEEEV